MEQLLKDGQAFLCTENVYRRNTLCFTANQLYYIDKGCYLVDNTGTHKNYNWFKDKFERSEDNDKK